MKRMGCAAALALAAGMLGACSSDGAGDGPMATVVTDRPTPITSLPFAATLTPTPTRASTLPPPPYTTAATAATATSTAAAQANSQDYAGKAPGWYYFASPSGNFECGIAVVDSSIAGCHGSLPASAPEVPGVDASEAVVEPNTVQLIAGSAAKFESLGDPKFHRFDEPAATLPYGELLFVPGSGSTNGLQCSVDAQIGVTCTDQVGHGFTVSSADFDLR